MSASRPDGQLPFRRHRTHPSAGNLPDWDAEDGSVVSSPPPPLSPRLERARTFQPDDSPPRSRTELGARRLSVGLQSARAGGDRSPTITGGSSGRARRPSTPEEMYNAMRPSGGPPSPIKTLELVRAEAELAQAKREREHQRRLSENRTAPTRPPRPVLNRSSTSLSLRDLPPLPPPPTSPLPQPPSGRLPPPSPPPIGRLPALPPVPPLSRSRGNSDVRRGGHGRRRSSVHLPPGFERTVRPGDSSSSEDEHAGGGSPSMFSLGAGNFRRARIYGQHRQRWAY